MFTDPIANALGEWAVGPGIGSLLLRVLLSAVISTIIGCERATKRHAAGVRTHVIVSLASTFIIMTDGFLASQINGYVYVLSAASIIAVATIAVNSVLYTSRNQIKGLTTSAALWACGILGLTAGAGLFTLTLVGFVLLMVSLSWMPVFERDLKNKSNFFEIHLELTNSQYLQDFITTLRRLGISIDDIEVNPAYASSGLSVYSISLSINSKELKQYKTHTEIIEALASLEYVYHIEEMVS
ncbi:MAG: MgtC/SapB family protein [Lachnospiraceae bacterium]|jgi:putative Mg2+ transporter-C (MgtC) family protein|nr:MgtC/SapB family protein [Lachnospiraceae bacterium]